MGQVENLCEVLHFRPMINLHGSKFVFQYFQMIGIGFHPAGWLRHSVA
jgi:hypothetical protein